MDVTTTRRFAAGGYAVFGRTLARIQIDRRRYGTDGYQVFLFDSPGRYTAHSHWVPARSLALAVGR